MRVAAAALAAWSLPAPAAHVPPLARALGLRTRLSDPVALAVTFDDGPHPRGTPAVLDALAAAGMKATFFLVGEQVRRTGGLAAEIVAAGHGVAIHGDRHRSLARLAPGAVRADFDAAADTIAAATGVVATLHRAPYGIYSWPALAELRRRGWTPVLWSAWGRDWVRSATPASIARHVDRSLGGGGIVLLHDADDYGSAGSWAATAAAVPRLAEAIVARGLRAVALPDASGLQPPGR